MFGPVYSWVWRAWRLLRGCTRDRWKDGAKAVDLVIALPVLTLMLFGSVQYGAFFFLKGTMGDAAQEAVRGLAMGALSEAQAVTQVEDVLGWWGDTFAITATLPGGPNLNSAVVEIHVPLNDVAFIQLPALYGEDDLSTRVTMWSDL